MLKYSSCAGWHGSTTSEWLYATSGFLRGERRVFSFDGYNPYWKDDVHCGRGVAVVGTGL